MAGCQRLPKNDQRVMKIPWEKEAGKTNMVVCVYLMGEVAKEREFFLSFPPLLGLLYIVILNPLVDLHFPCRSTTVCIYDMDAT